MAEPFDAAALLRQLPGVDQLLGRTRLAPLLGEVGHRAFVEGVRAVLDRVRADVRAGRVGLFEGGRLNAAALEASIDDELRRRAQPSLRRVLNATGIIAHTNLGRAPIAREALERLVAIAGGYSTLELDPATGRRAERLDHVERRLLELTGAEGAVVVNNNAAAVLLVLSALASGREVVVSRGELVEIGGSFRMPDVMGFAGCRLREIGTTNKTKLGDYREVIGEATAMLLKVHRSNFRIVGFTAEVEPVDLVALGREVGLPIVEDLGSGSLVRHDALGIRERTVQDAVRDGLDLVCFSGDKMLGGPQAGIIVGRAGPIARLRRHPLFRALRPCKLTLAALAGTLEHYWRGELDRIPVLRMLRRSASELRSAADALAETLRERLPSGYRIATIDGSSEFGAGSLPATPLPSRWVAVEHEELSASEIESQLRNGDPTILVCVRDERVILDVRTLGERDAGPIAESLRRIASTRGGGNLA